MLSLRDYRRVAIARRNGIVNPLIAMQECKETGLEYAVACAVLMRETSGGHNVFGHDPTIAAGWGLVTKAKYLAYKRLRSRTGKCQGVGPMQLTYGGFQDAADKIGGCWKVRYNMRIGFSILVSGIRKEGIYSALYHYNGSWDYAKAVLGGVNHWREVVR